jgi:hypothetical protein
MQFRDHVRRFPVPIQEIVPQSNRVQKKVPVTGLEQERRISSILRVLVTTRDSHESQSFGEIIRAKAPT